MSGVPTYIEFIACSQDHNAKDYDADIDEWSGIPTYIEFTTLSQQDITDKDYYYANNNMERCVSVDSYSANQEEMPPVSQQDLDAMKQMIYQIRQNPELLHQSAVYSMSVSSSSSCS